ncbi:MAG: ABC transporter ATP-binding protein [bacterium]
MLEIKKLKAKKGSFNLNIEGLSLKADTINLVLGPNGGGKTTLLKTLAGLIPYTGQVSVNQKATDKIAFKERAKLFGYLPQNIYLPELFVRDFLILGRFPYTSLISRYSQKDWEKVYTISSLLNINEYLDREMTTLSQGELQRVILAKVFIQEPKILLLDEPTTALDIGFKELVKNQIVKYLDMKPETIIIISTHEPDVFIERTEQIIMLNNGSVFESGPKDSVYNSGNIKKLFNFS